MVIWKQDKPSDASVVEKAVAELRREKGLSPTGIAGSNIRRQLRRLRDHFLIEKKGRVYRVTENMGFEEIFQEKIEKYHLPVILARVKEYCRAVASLKKE